MKIKNYMYCHTDILVYRMTPDYDNSQISLHPIGRSYVLHDICVGVISLAVNRPLCSHF